MNTRKKIVVARAEELWPHRHAVLRPDQPLETVVYPRDDAPDSGHFCCLVDGLVVAVASVITEVFEPFPDLNSWRVRGMATYPKAQGQGIGSRLLETCIRHARSHQGDVIWCTARTDVVNFYSRYKFEEQGEEFEIKGAGRHYVMQRNLKC